MKFNKYQLAAAGIAVVIIVIFMFRQRSDWDANKFILSADDQGNLVPKSEKYFDDKEKALLASVDQKIAAVNSRISGVDNRVTTVDNKVNTQRRDFNQQIINTDRVFATKADVNRLDRWKDGRDNHNDGRYIQKNSSVALQHAGGYYVGLSPHHAQVKYNYSSDDPSTSFNLIQA